MAETQVKRYDTFPVREVLHGYTDGRCVLYEDYDTLAAELQRVVTEIRTACANEAVTCAERVNTIEAIILKVK